MLPHQSVKIGNRDSKQINTLEKLNKDVIESTGINQWKNTTSVLRRVNKLPNKPNCTFISLDVIDFYPSIRKELVNDALDFA